MITSWSPSRLAKWEDCALRAKYEIVDKLCPTCFKGALQGPWGLPQVCNACGAVEKIPAAIARGTALHTACEQFIMHGGKVDPELKNVATLLRKYRKAYQGGTLQIEADMVFGPGWQPVSKFTKGAWLRTKLDVLIINGTKAEVTDWKSGGIDKTTGEIKSDPHYPEQVQIYATAVLSAHPLVEEVKTALDFIDAPAKRNRVTQGGVVKRADLPGLQKKWSQRAAGMLGDTIFAPRPSFACRWCPFSKTKKGPCSF